MTGVQTLVPLMLDHVNAGRLSLARFVDLTSAGPARVFGIARKGRIAAGYDADLTVVDLKRRETITNRWIASRAGWTPYDGVSVTGWPVGTVRARPQGDVAGRTGRAVAGRGGAVPGNDGIRSLILAEFSRAPDCYLSRLITTSACICPCKRADAPASVAGLLIGGRTECVPCIVRRTDERRSHFTQDGYPVRCGVGA